MHIHEPTCASIWMLRRFPPTPGLPCRVQVMLPLCTHHGQHGSGRPCAQRATATHGLCGLGRAPMPSAVHEGAVAAAPTSPPPPPPARKSAYPPGNWRVRSRPPPPHPPPVPPPDRKAGNEACITRHGLGLRIYADHAVLGVGSQAAQWTRLGIPLPSSCWVRWPIAARGLAWVPRCPGIYAS